MAMPRRCAAAGFGIGDRVCALVAGGGYAELCAAPVGQCLPSPAKLSDVEAASLPETFFTVWSNVFDRGRLQPGETLLVHGGSSGIGVTAIQLAKAHGADGDRHGRQRREGGGLPARSAPTTPSTTRRRTSSPRSSASPATAGVDVVLDMVAGDYIGARHQVPRRGRPRRHHRRAGRRRVEDRREPGAAPASTSSPARRCGRGRSRSRARSRRR